MSTKHERGLWPLCRQPYKAHASNVKRWHKARYRCLHVGGFHGPCRTSVPSAPFARAHFGYMSADWL